MLFSTYSAHGSPLTSSTTIPAMLYAVVIGIVGIICWFLAFFAVLFTGRWPEGLRAWAMKGLRVSIRTDAYVLLFTDEYPPFSTD